MRNRRLFITIILISVLILYIGNFIKEQYISANRYNSFDSFRQYKLKLPEKRDSITLVAVGDIMLSRLVDLSIKQNSDNAYGFDEVKWFWQNGDIIFGNLENPLIPGREIGVSEMVLRADPEMAYMLKNSGFNILSLANNHIYDFGSKGIRSTMKALNEVGIKYCGVGSDGKEEAPYTPAYMEANGTKIAFLAFTDKVLIPKITEKDEEEPGIAFLDKERIAISVSEAAKNGNFVIVYLHGGTEYAPEPDVTMRGYAHLAIDKGANLVLGSHPHVVQEVEKYRGKYIFHSLGNFIFDQLWSLETRESIIAKIYISENKVERLEFLPVFIDDNCFPSPIRGKTGQKIIEKLELNCEKETIPAWNNERKLFEKIEQYVYYTDNYKPDYRLIKNRQFDLDGDGIKENYKLKDGRIEVWKENNLIWHSPEEWWIDDFFLGDADNDGIEELGLLVWKTGSFGSKKPFWFEGEDTSFRNHLFLYKLINNEIKPIWQSSNLDQPNFHAILVDYNDDGKNELLVIEGSYGDFNLRKITLWEWNGWGFSKNALHSL